MQVYRYEQIDLKEEYKADYDGLSEKYLFLKSHTGKQSQFVNTKFIAFDTEALRISEIPSTKNTITQERQEFYCYDFYDGVKHNTGKDNIPYLIKTINSLIKKYRKVTILIHNAQYDTSLVRIDSDPLFMFLKERGIKINYKGKEHILSCKKSILDSNFYMEFSDKNRGFVLNILDTTNFFKNSLREIAKANGDKFATKEDYNLKPEQWNEYIKQNGLELVRKDTELLYNFFTDFVSQSKNNGISLKTTSASSAMLTFKQRFLKEDVWIPKDLGNELVRGYHGGRTEAYILGYDKEIHAVLDVKSEYPKVMKRYKYSTYPLECVKDPSQQYIENMLSDIAKEDYNYFIECKFEFQKETLRYPIGITHKKTKKLIFPKSSSSYEIITGREFFIAYLEGCNFQIKQVWKFANADIFSGYVDFFFKMKDSAKNDVDKRISKLFLNSLYGKFGQRKAHQEYHSYSELDVNTQKLLKRAYERGNIRATVNNEVVVLHKNYYITKSKEELKFPVMIGIEITANARLYNYMIQKIIGFQNVFYTDTDSFHVKWSIAQSLHENYPQIFPEDNTRLGQLDIEEKGYEEIFDVKDYKITKPKVTIEGRLLSIDNKIKQKGVNGVSLGNGYFESSLWSTKKSDDAVRVKSIKKHKSYKRDKLKYIKAGKFKLGIPLQSDI